MTFLMKPEPVKPVRKVEIREISIYDGMTLKEIVESFPNGIPDTAHFDADWDYDTTKYKVVYEELEDINKFNKRVSDYEKKKQEYNIWRKKFKKEIAEYEVKRAADIQAVLDSRAQERKLQLEKELKVLKKQLEGKT